MVRDMIDREFLGGFVKLYALWRSSQSETFGMQIMQEMRALDFKVSPGTLYPILHKLLEEKDVVVTNRLVNGKIRKCYRATAKGRREAEEVIERLSFLLRNVFR
jgi:PadR family transcriptional regulator, regulatory protein PadR